MRAFILLAVLLCSPHGAVAQEPTRIEIETALTRLLWAEASTGPRGFRDRIAMLFAIHRLDEHERRSSNMIETLGYHVGWWKDGSPPRRPWIAGIDTACEKPEGFPKKWNWQSHQLRCIQLVGLVRDYYAGRLRNPCKGNPNNWRARGRPSRKAKRIYYHVGCGRTLHNFFNTHRRPNGRPTRTILNRKRKQRRRALREATSAVDVPRPDRPQGGRRPAHPVLDALHVRHARHDNARTVQG